jgi:hypothetical protein
VLTKDQALKDITNTTNQQRYNPKHSNSEEDENCAKKSIVHSLLESKKVIRGASGGNLIFGV